MFHLHKWKRIPMRNQLRTIYICTKCGKKSWECKWFPDFFFRF